MRELRAVHFMTNLIDNGELDAAKHKRIYIHTIDCEAIVQDFSISSKLNTDWDFLQYLFESGRQLAGEFIEQHFDKIGKQSSTDIASKFM